LYAYALYAYACHEACHELLVLAVFRKVSFQKGKFSIRIENK